MSVQVSLICKCLTFAPLPGRWICPKCSPPFGRLEDVK